MKALFATAVALAVWAAPAAADERLRLGGKGARALQIATAGSTVAFAWRDASGGIRVAVGRRGARPGAAVRVPRVRRAGALRLAVNQRGDIALAWTVNDRTVDPDPEDRDGEYCCDRVWAAAKSASGRFGPRRRLSAAGQPASLRGVVLGSSGRATVAFWDRRGLRVASAARGRRFGSPRVILESPRRADDVVALAPGLIGYGLATYDRITETASTLEIFTRRLAGAAPRRIARFDTTSSLYDAALALSSNGRVALMWRDQSEYPEQAIVAATAEPGGELGEPREIARYRGYAGSFSSFEAAINDAGDAIFAVGQSASAGSVIHVGRSRRGGPVGPIQRLNARGYAPEPVVALDAEGRALATWRDGETRVLRVSFAGRTGRFGRVRTLARARGYSSPLGAFAQPGVAWLGWSDRGVRVRRVVRP